MQIMCSRLDFGTLNWRKSNRRGTTKLADCSLKHIKYFRFCLHYYKPLPLHCYTFQVGIKMTDRDYSHTPGIAMLQLYLSLVRPHLDYAASIWSPHMKKDKTLLENV